MSSAVDTRSVKTAKFSQNQKYFLLIEPLGPVILLIEINALSLDFIWSKVATIEDLTVPRFLC